MSCPYLIRRVDTFYFRLAVPDRLRLIFGCRELVKSLKTQNRRDAEPLALSLACKVKQLYLHIDDLMTNDDLKSNAQMVESMIDSEFKRKLMEPESFVDLVDLIISPKAKSKFAKPVDKPADANDLKQDTVDNDYQQQVLIKDAQIELLKSMVSAGASVPIPAKPVVSPLLSDVYDEFLKGCADKDSSSKSVGLGKLFLSFCGSKKRLADLSQNDVNDFFKQLVKYPGGRGGKGDEFYKLSFSERIEFGKNNGLVLMSAGNFKVSYRSPFNQFIKFLKSNYPDYGNLSVDHIQYDDFGGKRALGEDKQRGLRLDEVERLMCSTIMQSFAKNATESHKFWLAMIGLHTGARVNEICQLNPQTDIVQDAKTDILYFYFTDDSDDPNDSDGTESSGVTKRLKNESSKRKVPVHSALLNAGFEGYIERIKKAGHTRIFNKWKPKGERASPAAEVFFREHLKAVKLRDETLGKKVSGMHSLRSTFASQLFEALVDKSGLSASEAGTKIMPLIGHSNNIADSKGNSLSVTFGYIDKDIISSSRGNLTDLQNVIELLDYGLEFPKAL